MLSFSPAPACPANSFQQVVGGTTCQCLQGGFAGNSSAAGLTGGYFSTGAGATLTCTRTSVSAPLFGRARSLEESNDSDTCARLPPSIPPSLLPSLLRSLRPISLSFPSLPPALPSSLPPFLPPVYAPSLPPSLPPACVRALACSLRPARARALAPSPRAPCSLLTRIESIQRAHREATSRPPEHRRALASRAHLETGFPVPTSCAQVRV